MEIGNIHKLFLECTSAVIDTRKIDTNSMFFAIKGFNFDANTFAKEALEKGCKFVIIDNPNYYIDFRTILVDNSLNALQQLAQFHRKFLKTPIVALTGSNGKTTTKELINCVLSKKFNTKATIGNLNNHIGVPLTILSFTKETEIGIVEMGANHQKEIEFLCNIAMPDFGLITNFGKAHLEGFGGVQGVIIGKSEMYNYLKSNEKIAFVNLDDAIQVEKSIGIDHFTFGLNNNLANLNIKKIEVDPFVNILYNNLNIQSNLIGTYNAPNIINAILIGQYFKIDDQSIKNAIESYVPENNRSQLISKNSNEIILDAYNANPSSMKVAIDNFQKIEKSNKIMILGDMFELGEDSFKEHLLIVNDVVKDINCRCYFVGKCFNEHIIHNENIMFFINYDSFESVFKNTKPENATILIKGSRGMALERALDLI